MQDLLSTTVEVAKKSTSYLLKSASASFGQRAESYKRWVSVVELFCLHHAGKMWFPCHLPSSMSTGHGLSENNIFLFVFSSKFVLDGCVSNRCILPSIFMRHHKPVQLLLSFLLAVRSAPIGPDLNVIGLNHFAVFSECNVNSPVGLSILSFNSTFFQSLT